VPVVHTAHDLYLVNPTGNLLHDWERGGALARMLRALYSRCYLTRTARVDVFCAPSRHHLDFHRRLGCRAAAYRYVPNGLGDERAPHTAGQVGQGARVSREEPLNVLYMGRMELHKGVPVLLKAAQLLADSPVTLTLAGAGPMEARVRDRAAALPQLSFEGFVSGDRRSELFNRSDLLVLPSICLECFGTVLLEALSRGLAVVTTEIGGQAELVKPGLNGFMVKPGDAAGLAALLQDLATRPGEVRDMAAAAVDSVKAFTRERMLKAYLAAYQVAAE